MLAKYIIKKYGYKWDKNWQDTDNIISVLRTMESLDEKLEKVVIDIADYFKSQMVKANECPYCGEKSDYDDPRILCADCRETFGHSFIDEL
jgi:hypothetical protein